MKGEHIYFLESPDFRPAYYEVADHLWGENCDIDSDGDSETPGHSEWTELSIYLRSGTQDQQVHVDPVSTDPLVLKVCSPNAQLAERAVLFLQARSGGVVSREWPHA